MTTPEENEKVSVPRRFSRVKIVTAALIVATLGVGAALGVPYFFGKDGKEVVAKTGIELAKTWNTEKPLLVDEKTKCFFTTCTTYATQLFMVKYNSLPVYIDGASPQDAMSSMPTKEEYPDPNEYLAAMEAFSKLMEDPTSAGVQVPLVDQNKSELSYLMENDGFLARGEIPEKEILEGLVEATGDKNAWYAQFDLWGQDGAYDSGPSNLYSVFTSGSDKADKTLKSMRKDALKIMSAEDFPVSDITTGKTTLTEALNQGYAPLLIVYKVK